MILANERIELNIDEQTGAITGLLNKRTDWQIIRQPKLAMGLNMLVPCKEYRYNLALSEKQLLSSVEESENYIMLVWDKIYTERAGTLDIKCRASITLDGDQVRFDLSIDNQSFLMIEEVHYPCLGGLRAPAGSSSFSCQSTNCSGTLNTYDMEHLVANRVGYWGALYPTYYNAFQDGVGVPATRAPFEILQADDQGLYLGVHDPDGNALAFKHEFRPGFEVSCGSRISSRDEMSGLPTGWMVTTMRMPFLQPGNQIELAPVVVSPYEGDWHKGVDPYIQWRKTWHKRRPQPAWNEEIDSWMTLHINSSEQSVRYRYCELPDIAKEAKEHGVGVLQIIGWARGGQDGAEPYHDHDPQLGTREELVEAIRAIEEIGVRVLLMCKFRWCDSSIPEYETKLFPHTIKDMFGRPLHCPSYAYDTLMSQQGYSRRSGASLCHASSHGRAFYLEELDKLLSLGSSGLMYDELMPGTAHCFDSSHDHAYGTSCIRGTWNLAEEFYAAAQEKRTDFLLAGEGPDDYQSQFYSVNYLRSAYPGYLPAWKYIDPEMKMATCLIGWDDREMVNQCLTYGYIINYEPYNFKGRLSDFPDTVAYGDKALQLRRKLWDYIWRGRFRHTDGASVSPQPEENSCIYSVFENCANGKKAVVISNQNFEKQIELTVKLASGEATFTAYDPDGLIEQTSGIVMLPARSVVVLVEK